MSQRIPASIAIQYLQKRKQSPRPCEQHTYACWFHPLVCGGGAGRPQVHPNYGFRKQLQVFADCRYNPSCTNAEYIAWKRRQKREVTKYLNLISDTVPIIPDQLYISR